MGTVVELKVGGICLDWSKNHKGNDHGFLFQKEDRTILTEYELSDEEGGAPPEAFSQEVLSRRLGDIKPRLDLGGHTLEQARFFYEEYVKSEFTEGSSEENFLNFDELLQFVRGTPLSELDATYHWDHYKSPEKVKGRFSDEVFKSRIPGYSFVHDAYSEVTYYGGLLGFFPPYMLLRVLAECDSNLDTNVTWEFGSLVENGWAYDEDFVAGAPRIQRFMIATEGTSDAHILKHAFSLLRPYVSDFFDFIDVTERHPFPGTGNLIKFAEGLVRIDIQNRVLFVFDNDAEGYEAYQKTLALSLPPNVRALILPQLTDFNEFPCLGPEGLNNSNINGRAAAIECYLDLNIKDYPPAKVIWTNLKRDPNIYQGALEYKDSYTKHFFAQQINPKSENNYDLSKLSRVLDAIIMEASTIAISCR
ncbi:hypothetical protein TU86_14150 [Pseudomonas weihenstephanensis]|uniref:HEPN/Toprim N-terminal domain-containing protein n=1 Tax=Pseudomonas weihenstephanensis TaxID=1608994 RepID=A0A0J6IF17_9PSED|nr:HEPN/Toprim-associated domain-containing protein [Pseudomonas weihenstephanensis]KMN13210.1 hypothetical protein TU86_14150 [Pseudomonas weihenstephanensis]